MKKLMTMIAAVATAFGLYAADPTYLSGTSFEGTDGGALSDVAADLTELNSDNGGWAIGGEANVVSFLAEGIESYPQGQRSTLFPASPNNYFLKLKTGSEEVTRYAIDDSSAYDVAADGNYFFDSVVQLTAFDQDPSADITDAKVALWLLEDEDAGTTNLMIKVGSGDAIDLGDGSALLDKWVRVTIKALPIAEGKIGFVLFINTTAVVVDSTKAVDPTLNPIAQAYQKDGVLIVSGTDTEISNVGFKGTGYVDDIAFTQTVPGDWAADPAVYTIAWDDSKMANVMTNDAPVVGNSPVIVYGTAPETMKISWTGVGTYASGSATVDVGEDGNFDLTEIDVDEADATFGGKNWTITKAVELANEATADGELALLKPVDAIEIDNANSVVITLNLAGKKVESTTEGTAAITLTKGSLKIVDSSVGQTGSVVGYENTGDAISAWEDGTTLEIAAGTYEGVVGASEGILTISSETPKFAYAVNQEEGACTISYTMSTALTGKELIADPEDAPTFWIVGTPKVYVAKIGDVKYETLKAALESAKANDTIEVFADVEENQVSNNVPVTVTVNEGVKIEFNDTPGNYSWLVFADLTLEGKGTICKPVAAGGHSMIQVQKDSGAALVVNGTLIFTVGEDGQTVATSPSNAISVEGGTATINGGTFINYKWADDGRCVRAEGQGSVTINGGSFTTKNDDTVKNLPVNTKECYKSGGGGTVVIPGTSTATFNKDETMFCAAGWGTKLDEETGRYGLWELYTITFTVGDVVETNKIFKGDAVTHADPTAPTGYTFTGWQPAIATPAAANADYVAQFAAVEYTITYTTGNGADVTNGVTKYTIETETFNLPVAADIDMKSVEGVTFAGWTNATSEAVVTQVQKGTTGNLEFFAKWEAVAPAEKDPTEDDPQDIPDTEKASDRYGDKVPTTLANVSAKSIATWAQNNGKLVKGAEILENAFLLNCENTEAAINAAKENFKATSITIDSDGKVTVGTPDGALYNGTIKTLGKAALSDAEWSDDLAGKSFFELKLVPTNLTNLE